MIWIGLGGAAGAVSRYAAALWLGKRGSRFPWATLLVNAAGSLLLGLLAASESRLPGILYGVLGIGFCGAFTTFSTFGYEALTLTGEKRYKHAALYVISTLMLSIVFAWAGWGLAEKLA